MTFEIKLDTTPRGFTVGTFKDLYGWGCSIQESSLAADNAIWLGCSTDQHGEGLGPIDKLTGHHIGVRMHLNQEMVSALLPLLHYFEEHGQLPSEWPHGEEPGDIDDISPHAGTQPH